jgi:16S rRNA (cytosine967-C5)-methyltransferase
MPRTQTSHAPVAQVALWQQLQAVAKALAEVARGASAQTALDAVPGPLKPGVQALLFQVLRQWGRARALRDRLVQRQPQPLADALLCTALALAWDRNQAPYEPHTLVNQAVEAAKRHKRLQSQASFLNACLRRFLREQEALVTATDQDMQAQWNHPLWWIERLQHDHPDHWQTMLHASNVPAPMTLRVNTRQTMRDALQATWVAQGLHSEPVGPQGLILQTPMPVQRIPGFLEGHCSVQDAAAQCAAPLLLDGLVRPKGRALRVLDACAAPGGKTAHLLELLQEHDEVLALDVDAERCQKIHDNLARLQLAAEVRAADAALVDSWWDGRLFDAVLLDAPCTASGIVRRHPDARWLRRESDVAQLAQIQRQLLDRLWPLVAPGGRLLYCTCSVFREEGAAQIETFARYNTDAHLRPSWGHLRPQNAATPPGLADNLAGDHDGFFYALLEKRAVPT